MTSMAQKPIALKYKDAKDFSEGLACVSKGEKYGYVDTAGKVAIPLEFDAENIDIILLDMDEYMRPYYRENTALNFNEGMAIVNKKGKWGYIDKTGKVIVPIKYKVIGTPCDDMVMVGKSKYGFLPKPEIKK